MKLLITQFTIKKGMSYVLKQRTTREKKIKIERKTDSRGVKVFTITNKNF